MATLSTGSNHRQDIPELIPARMLNEFAYCPRLCYLEWVQGEFADNLDTHEGRFDHRRVDRASRQSFNGPAANAEPGARDQVSDNDDTEQERADEPPPFETRSLMLSAPGEGLIAKMDIVEHAAAEAVPVDYKHGRVPNTPEGYWEPEAVQLCAQGLILRENGYQCEGGFLYFVESRRRVAVPFDDALVDRTREFLQSMREMARAQRIPPPLEDSRKCNRCSLVGICLPDETNLLRRGPVAEVRQEARPVRRLLPQHDTALPLYVQQQGAIVGRSGDEITVKQKGDLLDRVRLKDISQLALLGNVMLTAPALRELAARNIPICHMTYGGWFHATTHGMTHKNVELRITQHAAAADASRSLALAGCFVTTKIKNCRTLLRRHLEDDPSHTLDRLSDLVPKAASAVSLETLLGIEGTAARLYFEEFPRLIKQTIGFSLDGRNRRPPRDPVNAILSFVYAILAKDLAVAVQSVGLDPHLGFLHRPRYGRPSLALDLMEEFRPIVADSVVMTVLNNGEIRPDGFIRQAGAVAMTTATRRAVLSAYERRLASLVTHPSFGYRISYRRVFEVQARLLARALTGEIDAYPGFYTR